MALDNLREKLNDIFKKLKSRGKLTEADIKVAMREIRLVLLEADVHYKVAKDFIEKVSARSIGAEVLESLTPGQHVIKIVNEELIKLMGDTSSKINYADKPPTVLMMVGLQGTGKTTTSAKLAGLIHQAGKRPLLVACDVYRPAAIDQLKTVGAKLNIPVYFEDGNKNVVQIAKNAMQKAMKDLNDVVIIDTAGRLHIDEDLMKELTAIQKEVNPTEILLVVDAMSGQDAVNSALAFNEQIGIDGVILTKLDGDSRGGSALSVKAVTGKPIKFVGTGEKLDEIEVFHPERMAGRILGMGDVLSLIEKAQQSFDEKKALELEQKIRSETFTLDDFLDQMQQIKKMGSLESILSMMPGMNNKALKSANVDEKQMLRTEAIIKSMTTLERVNPSIINFSRKNRIAKGSGTTVHDINSLLTQFTNIKKMMKQFSGNKIPKQFKGFF